MRYKAEHKQMTRERVLKAAARQIRERGPHGISLANVMSDAGLTHGGFYAHFDSKDDFMSEAIEHMFEDSPIHILQGETNQSARETLSRFIDFYLSPDHRDMCTVGCPLPFLSGDTPRLNENLRNRISRGIEGMIKLVKAHLANLGRYESESEADATVAQIIGAVILARAIQNQPHSDALLARTRTAVRQHLGLED